MLQGKDIGLSGFPQGKKGKTKKKKRKRISLSCWPNLCRAVTMDLKRVPSCSVVSRAADVFPDLTFTDTGSWSMEGRKGPTEVMEIPATAAALADLLLTNTLPGTWISSWCLQQRKAGWRKKDEGKMSKRVLTCRKSKVFEDVSWLIQSFKDRFTFLSTEDKKNL